MVDLAQTIEEWKDIQSVKVDDQVGNDDDDDDGGGDDDQVGNGDKDRCKH